MIEAEFAKSGDPRYFWTERRDRRTSEIALTWYDIGEPLLIHTQPGEGGRHYGVCTLLIPALGARLTVDGVQAAGRPWPMRARRPAVQHLRARLLRELDRTAIEKGPGCPPSVNALAPPVPGLSTGKKGPLRNRAKRLLQY